MAHLLHVGTIVLSSSQRKYPCPRMYWAQLKHVAAALACARALHYIPTYKRVLSLEHVLLIFQHLWSLEFDTSVCTV